MPEFVAGGALVWLATNKHVRRAIGRLIFAATDVPAAYFEKFAQNIRNDKNHQKQIACAVAPKASKPMVGKLMVSKPAAKDDQLIGRAYERNTRQLAARQKTREDIAVRTLNVLAESEALTEAAAPSEDFMRMFEDIAEKVSSEQLADLMARILAGEIRKPGSVSRRTLQVVAILDQDIVGALNELRPYLLDPGWVIVPPSIREDWRQRFSLLSSVSISNEIGPRSLSVNENNKFFITIGDKVIVVTCRPAKFGWHVNGANLTPIGDELISALPLRKDIKVKDIASGMKEYNFVKKVEIGNIKNVDGKFIFKNLREYL